jgi:diguanylate cyclase (GGDEF)-like protein
MESPPNPSPFPDSPYAVELQGGFSNFRFSPALEAEYVHAHLLYSRTLIRVACALAVLLAVFRGVEQVVGSPWGSIPLVDFGLVISSSIVLAAIAWSPAFERLFLPWARIVVPARNMIVALHVAEAAAHGQLEMLMMLPVLLIGPFFFLGLRFRTALISCVLTVATFVASAMFFELALPVALRACALLFMGAIACTIAARHLEKWSRTSFLETHLIAELAQHDALTRTKNRRAFDEYLARLWNQASEDSRAIAILLIDVDHFKAYNDRHGHQAGDQALRRVAETVQAFVRRPLDVLARYGGEEFVAILYDIDRGQAMSIANRICRAVEESAIEQRGSKASNKVTISVGVAVIEPTIERSPRGALQLADQALYEAKAKGRNRVECMDNSEYGMLVTGMFSKRSSRR